DLTLHEVNEASSVVVHAAGEEANVIFGAVIDPNMDGELMITVIATGFGHVEPRLKFHASRQTREEQEDLRRPSLRSEEVGAGAARRSRTRGHGAHLEGPPFLRRPMARQSAGGRGPP